MIINHTYKFIFIKTQKTASTSIEIALSSLCDENDIVTVISPKDEAIRQKLGYQGPTNDVLPITSYGLGEITQYFNKTKRKAYYNHISCREVKELIGDEIYDSYYKFCFERNPYDKAISLFFHQGGYQKWKSIEEFIQHGGLKIINGFDQYTIDKIVAVDDIFKFENIQEGLDMVSEKLKLDAPIQMPETKSKSKFRKDKRPYSEVLTSEEKKLIDVIWARERELIGYTF